MIKYAWNTFKIKYDNNSYFYIMFDDRLVEPKGKGKIDVSVQYNGKMLSLYKTTVDADIFSKLLEQLLEIKHFEDKEPQVDTYNKDLIYKYHVLDLPKIFPTKQKKQSRKRKANN